MDYLGWMCIVVGLTYLASARFGWAERLSRTPVLGTLLIPLRLLNVGWIGGGTDRAQRTMGWFFLLVGVFVVALAWSRTSG